MPMTRKMIMDKLQEAIENIGKFAIQAGMSAKEFSEYLKMLAANAPIEVIEKEIHNLKIEKVYLQISLNVS